MIIKIFEIDGEYFVRSIQLEALNARCVDKADDCEREMDTETLRQRQRHSDTETQRSEIRGKKELRKKKKKKKTF